MKYLENAIRFSIKNWMLILPLFALTALVHLLGGIGSSAMYIGKLWSSFGNPDILTNPMDWFKSIGGILSPFAVGTSFLAGLIAFVAPFIYLPLTYSLVNKSLETGNASLNDIGSAIEKNFVKYLLYFVGTLVLGIIIAIGLVLIGLIFYLLVLLLKGFGFVLMGIVIFVLIIAGIIFSLLISMWFSAMIIDELDVVAAFKKSIEVVRGCFWTVLGITLLVGIAAAIAGGILGLLSLIPLLGPIIYSVVPTAQTFIMLVFLMMLYREKTGRVNAI